MRHPAASERWPALPSREWAPTRHALRLWAQIVGEHRLARAPWASHSRHATLIPGARGPTTSLVFDRSGRVEIVLDLLDHLLRCDAVRDASDPHATLLALLESTHRAAAGLGGWDHGALECPMGMPRRPRPIDPRPGQE